MQSIIIHRIASTAVMPLVAAGGWAGYNQYNQPYEAPQYACVAISNTASSIRTSDVVNIQRLFVSLGYLHGTPSGRLDSATMQALARFQADHGLPITGRIDSATRLLIQQMTCGTSHQPPYQGGTGGQLSVSGLDAPRQLMVGQQGTWSVRVNSMNSAYGGYQGGSLHYTVVWGDEQYAGVRAQSYYPATTVSSSGTFTHTYTRVGTYTPVFVVTDEYGHRTQTSASISVINRSTTYVPPPSTYCGNSGHYGNCYGDDTGYVAPPTYGGTSGCSSYYDRNCYVNGQYVGPDFGSGYPNNGPDGCRSSLAAVICGNDYGYTYTPPYAGSYGCSDAWDRNCYDIY